MNVIISQELNSIGDALREIDAKQILKSDFILISGDVITNAPLKEILDEHKATKEKDKNCIMTMVSI